MNTVIAWFIKKKKNRTEKKETTDQSSLISRSPGNFTSTLFLSSHHNLIFQAVIRSNPHKFVAVAAIVVPQTSCCNQTSVRSVGMSLIFPLTLTHIGQRSRSMFEYLCLKVQTRPRSSSGPGLDLCQTRIWFRPVNEDWVLMQWKYKNKIHKHGQHGANVICLSSVPLAAKCY